MQGDSQPVGSSQSEGVLLRDTSTLDARRSRGSNQQPSGYQPTCSTPNLHIGSLRSFSLLYLQLVYVNKPIRDLASDAEEEEEEEEEEKEVTDTATVSRQPIRGDYYRSLSDPCIEIHSSDTQMERLKVSRTWPTEAITSCHSCLLTKS